MSISVVPKLWPMDLLLIVFGEMAGHVVQFSSLFLWCIEDCVGSASYHFESGGRGKREGILVLLAARRLCGKLLAVSQSGNSQPKVRWDELCITALRGACYLSVLGFLGVLHSK